MFYKSYHVRQPESAMESFPGPGRGDERRAAPAGHCLPGQALGDVIRPLPKARVRVCAMPQHFPLV